MRPRARREPPAADPARASALLEATNRFLSANDLDQLSAAIIGVSRAIFTPWKVALVLGGADGRGRVAASLGYDRDEVARIDAALAQGGPLARRAAAGEELWSDDPGADEVRSRVRLYGGAAAFTLPIVTTAGVAGSLGVMYRTAREFDEPFRETARMLCAQAALAHELIATREDLRRNAIALQRQTRLARALFQISQRLATVSDPEQIPRTLATAIREATGASYSLVGRWNPERGRVGWAAVEGLRPEQRALLQAFDPSPARFRMIRGGLEGRANVRVPPFDPDDVPVDIVEALGITALAGAPVTVDGRPWGLIAVGTAAGDPSIVETGAELLSGLAAVAATAIGRAQASASLARQASVLESAIAERTVQLREAVAELRFASQAKTELLANVSHELRTPLTAILGFSEVLLQGLDGPLTQEQQEDVQTIDRSGRHLLELIDDLIDVSRIEAGRVELRPEQLSIVDLVASTVEEIRPLAAQKGLSLASSVGRVRRSIVADPARVHEILLNLLGNAVKFTQPGGRIAVRTAGRRGGVLVEVADTGIGIAPAHHQLVFEKFQRLAGPEYPGTGLGLSIARDFARLHGGELGVDSRLGEGSRFTLRLPHEPPAAPPAAEP